MARDSLFPPKKPDNRSFELAALGKLRPNTGEDKGLSPEAQKLAAEVMAATDDPKNYAVEISENDKVVLLEKFRQHRRRRARMPRLSDGPCG